MSLLPSIVQNHQDEWVLPVTDLIEIHHKDQRKMDDYVLEFSTWHHGYRMRIGNSQHKTSSVSHYECYRSGYPPNKGRTTQSARIGCPFKLDTRYLYHSSSWMLIHTHLGHNHPANPKVKPLKRYIDPEAGPILAPGVVLEDNTKSTLHKSANVTSNGTSKIEPTLTVEGTNQLDQLANTISCLQTKIEPNLTAPTTSTDTLPHQNMEQPYGQWYYVIKTDQPSLDTLDTIISQLKAQLCAMAPDCRQDVLKKIQTIITNERIINDEGRLPISFLPEPHQQTLLYESVNDNTQTFPHAALDIGLPEEHSVERLIEEFCGPSEITTSTFNFEDLLISQPTLEGPQPSDTRAVLTQNHSPLTTTLDTGIEAIEALSIDLQVQSQSERFAEVPHKTIALESPPSKRVCTSPTSSSHTSQPPPCVTTRKRAQEAQLLQRPNVINPNLPALVAKYHLHSWLEPFVIDVREVKADGHCGFRAIAISIGQSEDNWERIRQMMADTVTNMEDNRSLPQKRADALARLLTSKPNVASERQHWLGMPSWGGVIATTFDQPVLYYDPVHIARSFFRIPPLITSTLQLFSPLPTFTLHPYYLISQGPTFRLHESVQHGEDFIKPRPQVGSKLGNRL